jgi:hypothetical protein
VDEETDTDLAVDIWDNTGPDRGRLAQWGGFADPNCLIVDKRRAAHHFAAWAQTGDLQPGFLADRRFYAAIAPLPHAHVETVTMRYRIRRTNVLHHYVRAGSNEPSVLAALEAHLKKTRQGRAKDQFFDGAGGSG